MEINVNAEYLDFKSFEEVLDFQEQLLAMPAYEARKRLLSTVARESTWYQFLFLFSENDYQKALKNGQKSLVSDTEFDYVSLSDYQDYLTQISKYARPVTSFPLLPTISFRMKENMDKLRTITGFNDIEKLFDNYGKLQTILEPTNDLDRALNEFLCIEENHVLPYIEFDENENEIEPEKLSEDEVRQHLRIEYKKMLAIADLIYSEDYPKEMTDRLKLVMEEVGKYLDNMDKDGVLYESGQVGDDLYEIVNEFFHEDLHTDSYTILRDEKKEEELRKKKEDYEKTKKLASDKEKFKNLPQLIQEQQNKIDEYKKSIDELQQQISTTTDYLAISEIYKEIAELTRNIGFTQNTLNSYKGQYEELKNQFNSERPTNKEMEEKLGIERIVDGIRDTNGIEEKKKNDIVQE